tara:strand:- start:301 stop:534 length:234 start_codon:yes stop_codon:yes gene_type:complete
MSVTEQEFMKIVDSYATQKFIEGTFMQKSINSRQTDPEGADDASRKREKVYKIAEERREAVRTAFDDIIDIVRATHE